VLPHLIRYADMGNSLIDGKEGDLRLRELTTRAPRLEPRKVTQLAALPLGGRIKVDPWNNTIEINKSKPVQLLTAREKMPLEVTPVFPHLTRFSLNTPPATAPDSAAAAEASPVPEEAPADTPDAAAAPEQSAPQPEAPAPPEDAPAQ